MILFKLIFIILINVSFGAGSDPLLYNEQHTKRIGFHVGLTRHRSLHPSDTVVFDKIITNIGNGYNNESGHFTAPSDGMYTFTATFLSNSDRLGLIMLKNTEWISSGYTDNGGSCTLNAVVSLSKEDVVKIQYWALGVIGRIEAELCYFSGYFIN